MSEKFLSSFFYFLLSTIRGGLKLTGIKFKSWIKFVKMAVLHLRFNEIL